MSDADYHEGYYEGIRNCSQSLLHLIMEGGGLIDYKKFQNWLMSELSDAKRIKEEFRDES